MDVRIRVVSEKDAEMLLDIYRPYVENTAITFEYDVPSPAEFRERIKRTLQKYPYIAAESNGKLLGYAYTSAFVGRAAYDWAAETSIYLQENSRKMGIGKQLYQAIEAISRAQHILNPNACIAYTDSEDRHLTNNSAHFHEHLGYRMVGRFYQCGYKFGTWYDMVWMEKIIGSHPSDPRPVIPFSALDPKTVKYPVSFLRGI